MRNEIETEYVKNERTTKTTAIENRSWKKRKKHERLHTHTHTPLANRKFFDVRAICVSCVHAIVHTHVQLVWLTDPLFVLSLSLMALPVATAMCYCNRCYYCYCYIALSVVIHFLTYVLCAMVNYSVVANGPKDHIILYYLSLFITSFVLNVQHTNHLLHTRHRIQIDSFKCKLKIFHHLLYVWRCKLMLIPRQNKTSAKKKRNFSIGTIYSAATSSKNIRFSVFQEFFSAFDGNKSISQAICQCVSFRTACTKWSCTRLCSNFRSISLSFWMCMWICNGFLLLLLYLIPKTNKHM